MLRKLDASCGFTEKGATQLGGEDDGSQWRGADGERQKVAEIVPVQVPFATPDLSVAASVYLAEATVLPNLRVSMAWSLPEIRIVRSSTNETIIPISAVKMIR